MPLPRLPRRGPERLVFGERPQRQAVPVGGVLEDGVAPPCLDGGGTDLAVLGELQDEEDEDRRDCETRVQAGR